MENVGGAKNENGALVIIDPDVSYLKYDFVPTDEEYEHAKFERIPEMTPDLAKKIRKGVKKSWETRPPLPRHGDGRIMKKGEEYRPRITECSLCGETGKITRGMCRKHYVRWSRWRADRQRSQNT